MSNLSKQSAAFLSTQKSLLDIIEEKEMVLNLDIATAIRQAVSEAIRTSGRSRWQIAAAMSEYLGREITKAQIDSFSAESKEGHRFPLEYVPAFCHATRNYDLVALAAGALRIQVVLPEDAEEARLLLAELELQRMTRKVAEMKRTAEARRRRMQ